MLVSLMVVSLSADEPSRSLTPRGALVRFSLSWTCDRSVWDKLDEAVETCRSRAVLVYRQQHSRRVSKNLQPFVRVQEHTGV